MACYWYWSLPEDEKKEIESCVKISKELMQLYEYHAVFFPSIAMSFKVSNNDFCKLVKGCKENKLAKRHGYRKKKNRIYLVETVWKWSKSWKKPPNTFSSGIKSLSLVDIAYMYNRLRWASDAAHVFIKNCVVKDLWMIQKKGRHGSAIRKKYGNGWWHAERPKNKWILGFWRWLYL